MLKLVCPSYHEPLVTYDQLDWPRLGCDRLISEPVILEVPIAPADLIVAPEVGVIYVISPTGVLNLVDYSSSTDSNPSEDSLPTEQRPERHESLIPSSEFPLAPVVAPPEIRQRPAILVPPGEAIPFGRPYRTHPNGSRKLLTARKRVRPFPASRLAWRRVSHRSLDRHSSPNFTSDSSSSSSSSDSSSDISLGSSSYSLSNSSLIHSSCQSHSGPSTRVASPRLVDPPSSLDSSSKKLLDSSSPSVGPSRKRCISPITLVSSFTPVTRSIAPTLADLPPRKRKRIFKKRSKKKAKNKQVQARDGKGQVKSKSKVIRMKKIQLEGLKLPSLKLYYKRLKRQGPKLPTG
ncbi:hypothetical protein Tco_0988974 [Tanacetum coccineum]|uniref:Uncharacterized protein n=1 Tax=Tanacetum coccineum TaxID=301880 RepID=A0ABQ5ESF8_9ASTR